MEKTKKAPKHKTSEAGVDIGAEIKTRRLARAWTLEELSERSGVSIAAISKIEKGQSSPSFETILKITRPLQVNFVDMLDGNSSTPESSARLISTTASDIEHYHTDFYDYHVHSGALKRKAMIPLQMTVRTRDVPPPEDWSTHSGEEFVLVLSGKLELHTEQYATMTLAQGESCYFDSTMPHAFVSATDEPTEILSMCLSIKPFEAAD
ncbi:helix-turn-helix domain-containing protein [uncultured Roseobacter sp.]|uniref:helix-turn-helix domain-containing protein n=1 Tax=uncultured Roseobacter sp. TaxID=114847 RepID=UPI002603025F|nr:XRE family transcriptional regulator [uncultured Roseobacter sp.]